MQEPVDVKDIWETILVYVGYFFSIGIFLGIFDPAHQEIYWQPYVQAIGSVALALVVWFRRFFSAKTLAYYVVAILMFSALLIMRRYGTPSFVTFHILTMFLVTALILPKWQSISIGVVCTTIIILLPILAGWGTLDSTYVRWSVYSYLGATIYCVLILSFRERINQLLEQEITIRNNARKFFSNMAREMETPISSLKIINEGLIARQLPGDLGSLINVADDTLNHLDHLVTEVVDVTNIETSTLFLDEEPFDMQLLIFELVGDFEHKLKSKSLSYQLDLNIPKNTLFVSDAVKLKKLFSALMSNAVSFTQKGRIKIACQIGEAQGNQAQLLFSISDTGIGIPLEKQSDVFKPFVKLSDAESAGISGVGLGLTVARQIVRAFGGNISLSSEPNQGTQVDVRLTLNFINSASNNQHTTESTPLHLKGIRIAMLSQGSKQLANFATHLQLNGARVQVAPSIQDLPNDALLTADIMLISMLDDTVTACEQAELLRGLNYLRPIVGVVDGELSKNIAAALAAGMNGYLSLQSPLDQQLLRIEGCLRAFREGYKGNQASMS